MASALSEEAFQYLTFRIGKEDFAFDISRVREVRNFSTLSKAPKVPDFVRDVIDLRGMAVPVADLRLALGKTKTEKTMETCVIIAEVAVDGNTSVLGILADSVKEVLDLGHYEIEPVPKIGTHQRTGFTSVMGNDKGHFITILDIDRIFFTEELFSARESGYATGAPAAA